jgi:CRISPR/Cas system CSM-associated protein Csm3 (group 7 of RAMP superfamily)
MTLLLTFQFSSAVHHGSGYGIGGLVDRAVQRRSDGEYVLSGSAIKGKFRHAALQVQHGRDPHLCWPRPPCRGNPCLLCQVFGSPRHRGAALFEDALVCEPERSLLRELRALAGDASLPLDSGVRARTAVDRRRKVVCGQHLFTTETTPPSVRFQSMIRGLSDQSHVDLLLVCTKVLATFGADSARGLGFCSIDIVPQEEPATP